MAFRTDIAVIKNLPKTVPFTWQQANGTPVDLTGATAKMMAKPKADPTQAPLLTLTTQAGGGITLGGTAGTISIAFTAAQTATPGLDQARYDLVITFANGTGDIVMEGIITVKQSLTDLP